VLRCPLKDRKVNVGDAEYFSPLLFDQMLSIFGSIEMYPECADILIRWIESSDMRERMVERMNADDDEYHGTLVYKTKLEAFDTFMRTLNLMAFSYADGLAKQRVEGSIH
jgi:hypothetical protein